MYDQGIYDGSMSVSLARPGPKFVESSNSWLHGLHGLQGLHGSVQTHAVDTVDLLQNMYRIWSPGLYMIHMIVLHCVYIVVFLVSCLWHNIWQDPTTLNYIISIRPEHHHFLNALEASLLPNEHITAMGISVLGILGQETFSSGNCWERWWKGDKVKTCPFSIVELSHLVCSAILMELVWLFQHATIYFFKLARCHCPCGPPFVLRRNELKCSTVVQSCLRIKSSLCIATSPRFSSLIRLQFPSEVVSSLLLGFPNNDDIDWHQLTLMDMEIPWNSHNYHFKLIFFVSQALLPNRVHFGAGAANFVPSFGAGSAESPESRSPPSPRGLDFLNILKLQMVLVESSRI